MIAVYYCYGIRQNKGKEGMIIVPVVDDDFGAFLEVVMESEQFPFPDSEVVFIEGSEVVNRWDPHA